MYSALHLVFYVSVTPGIKHDILSLKLQSEKIEMLNEE